MSDDDAYIREQLVSDRVNDSLALVKRLMAGRKDWRGRDYFLHDIEVMELLPSDATEMERMAALLHSVFEVGAATPEQLLQERVPAEVIDIVTLVTNGPMVRSYGAYVDKCRAIIASGNRAAMRVKLADMLANAGHPTNDYSETIAMMRTALGCELRGR